MSNGDWSVPPSTVTFPPFAGPGTPRITEAFEPDIPPELVAYYNVGPARITSAILWYYGNAINTYHYYAVRDLGGGVPPGNVVRGDVLSGLVIQADVYSGADWSVNRVVNADTTPLPGSVGGDFYINGKSHGVASFNAATVNGAATAVELALFNSSQTWRAGRCYEMWIDGLIRPGGGAVGATFLVRRINIAGGAYIQNLTKGFTALGDERFTMMARMRNSSAVDITQNLTLTIQPTSGVGTVQVIASAANLNSWKIQDCGISADFAGVNSFV